MHRLSAVREPQRETASRTSTLFLQRLAVSTQPPGSPVSNASPSGRWLSVPSLALRTMDAELEGIFGVVDEVLRSGGVRGTGRGGGW